MCAYVSADDLLSRMQDLALWDTIVQARDEIIQGALVDNWHLYPTRRFVN